jgi:hypothetical protein
MTDEAEESRRLRDAFAATSPEDVPTAECPSAERIWEATRNELGPAELRQVLLHVASCAVCTEAWRLAEELESSQPDELAESPARPERGSAFGWLKLAGAAAGIVAVFLVGMTLRDQFTVGSSARGLSLLSEGEAISRSDCRVQWIAVEGATYDVQVLTEGLEVLTEESGLSSPEYAVPAEVFESTGSGTVLLLHIEARRPRELPVSRTVRLPC